MLLEEGVKFNNFLKDWAKKAKQPLSKVRKTMTNKNTLSIAKLNDISVDKVLDGKSTYLVNPIAIVNPSDPIIKGS